MNEILDVFGLDASDGVLRTLALALPVLVLLTLLMLLIWARRRSKARARAQALPNEAAKWQDAPLTAVDDHSARSEAAVRSAISEPSPPTIAAVATTLEGTAQAAVMRAEKPSPAGKMPPADRHFSAIEKLQSQLNEAMKHAPPSTLAPLFLDMARHHKAAGDESSFLAALRSAAGLAAQHGPRAAHAEARLELAEAAFKAGDLIGACEQWQMARNALQDDGQKDAHALVDKRMRDNGCPTDWVLTDF